MTTPTEAALDVSDRVRDKLRSDIKDIISAHVSECFVAAGSPLHIPRHPGPTADAIIARFERDILARLNSSSGLVALRTDGESAIVSGLE